MYVHTCILFYSQLSLEEKIGVIAREIYGADGISLSDEAKKKIEDYTRQVRYEKVGITCDNTAVNRCLIVQYT